MNANKELLEALNQIEKEKDISKEILLEAIENSVKMTKLRMCVVSIGLLFIGLLFVLMAPSAVKYIALNLMFMAVILLSVGLYVIPFVWSVFITRSRKREYKIKASNIESK